MSVIYDGDTCELGHVDDHCMGCGQCLECDACWCEDEDGDPDALRDALIDGG